jgi:putative ABC transport system permease protein
MQNEREERKIQSHGGDFKMGSLIHRSLRNLVRSPLRTILVLVILVFTIGLALIMLTINGAFENQLNSISTQVGTDVEVRPAGFFGTAGGGEPLDESKVDKLSGLSHVVSVSKTVEARYSGNSLVSAIQPGTLGQQGGQSLPSNNANANRNTFRMGIIVMGMDTNNATPVLTGGAQLKIVKGRYFEATENDANVVILGQDLATANKLVVGSKFGLNGTQVEVIGIFDSGQLFGNNMIVLPVKPAQQIFSIKGITSATVTVDDANNETAVVAEIRTIFDEKTADIVTSASTFERISGSITNAIKTSQIGMIAVLAVAAIVIIFSIILMIRQKVKEVGILKAIGASNFVIGLGFAIETFFISIFGAVIGALITFPLAQKVANLLVGAASFTNRGGAFGGGGVTRIGNINIAVSPEIFLYALGFAVALAVIASLIPLWYISKVKPAEVLRYE